MIVEATAVTVPSWLSACADGLDRDGYRSCVSLTRTDRVAWSVVSGDGGPPAARRARDEGIGILLVPDRAGVSGRGPCYAAARGCDRTAFDAALSRVSGHAAGPHHVPAGGTTPPLPGGGVDGRPAESLPAALAAVLRTVRPPAGTDLAVQAHLVGQCTVTVPGHGLARAEVRHSGAVVFDLLLDGEPVADRSVTWSGQQPPPTETLVALAEQVVAGRARPVAEVPAGPVHLLLTGGAASMFLHEVCGHLLEHRADRPSLLAAQVGSPVTLPDLTMRDEPRLASGYGSHALTALGRPTVTRTLIDAGRLVGLLGDDPDGPWRAGTPRHRPAPRMSNTVACAPVHPGAAPDPAAALDAAVGDARVPVLRVHRLGVGSLDHRTGAFVLNVEEADTVPAGGGRGVPVHPFAVHGEARLALADLRAVGPGASNPPWSAYCLGTSGQVPVGGVSPDLLTGPLRAVGHRGGSRAADPVHHADPVHRAHPARREGPVSHKSPAA